MIRGYTQTQQSYLDPLTVCSTLILRGSLLSHVPVTIFPKHLLFSTGSVQEMSQLQMKLQQTQSARTISEELNKTLQVSQSTALKRFQTEAVLNTATNRACVFLLLTGRVD